MRKSILIILFFMFLIPLFGDNVSVSVNYSTNVNAFSPYHEFGVNSAEWDSYNNRLYPNVWQFQAAGFKIIRFPGGSNSNLYHWNGNGSYDSNGIWTVAGSPNPASFSSGFMDYAIHRGSTSVGYGFPGMVTDGNPATEWLSYPNETTPQWIYLDLSSAQTANGIVIDWDTYTYATQYKVQYSNATCYNGMGTWAYNDTAWTDTSLGVVTGTGGQANLSFNAVDAEYFRVLCLSSSVPTNQYAIGEIYLYNGSTAITANVNSVTQTASVSSSVALGDVNYSQTNPANMDFEQFMSICRSLTPPADPLITINFFTGTTQEAADWVYYADVYKGYNIKYWEIGNENWGNWEAGGPVNAQMYARRFLAFFDAMTAVANAHGITITVIPQFVSASSPENVTYNASICPPTAFNYYIQDFFNYLQAQGRLSSLQGISIHEYPTYEPTSEAAVLADAAYWDNQLTNLNSWISTYCPGQSVPIWLTEYNDGTDSGFTDHFDDSLFISSFMLDYIKNGGSFGCFFQDFGTPGPGQFDKSIYSDFGCIEGGGLDGSYANYRYQPRASYYALSMLSNTFSAADALGNTMVSTTSNDTSLNAYANKRGDGKLSVMLVNTSSTNTMNTSINITGFTPLASADVTTYSPQQYSWIANGTQSYANPDLPPVAAQITNASQSFSYTVPPYNIAIITMYDSTQPTLTPSNTPTQGPTPVNTPTPMAYGGDMVDECGNQSTVDLWGGTWDSYGDAAGSTWSPDPFGAKAYGNVMGYQCYYATATGTVSSNTGAWGFGMSAPLSPSWGPVDVSGYDGIIFEYKGDGYQTRVFLNQSDIGAAQGYSYYGENFTAGTTWTSYMMPFSAMTQASGVTGTAFTRTNIQAISFQTWGSPHANACIAVNDLGFYKNTPTITTSPQSPTNTPVVSITMTPTFTQTSTPGIICQTDTMAGCSNKNIWGGYWFTFNDCSNSGTSVVWPPAGAVCGGTEPPFVMSSPGYGGAGDCAAQMTGVVTTTYQYGYIGMGTGLNPNSGGPNYQSTDISGAKGISFYTKGDGGTYKILIPYLSSSGGTLDNWDDYNCTFTASSGGWTLVTLPFTSFTQPSYTTSQYIVSLVTVLQSAKQVQFETITQPIASVDLWIDNFSIYGCIVPTATNTTAVTATGTASATITPTNTQTITPTGTPSYSATPTYTPSMVCSSTITPTITLTSTISATYTITLSPTITPTIAINLAAVLTLSPSSAAYGQQITVVMQAVNTGMNAANNVLPSLPLAQSGGGAALLVGPSPASTTIAGNSQAYFTWVYSVSICGNIIFSGTVSGTDAVDGAVMTSSQASTNMFTCATETMTITATPTWTATPTLTATQTVFLSTTSTPTMTMTCTPTPMPAALAIGPVKPYPNPYNPDTGMPLKFAVNVTTGGIDNLTLRIYTASYRLIRRQVFQGADIQEVSDGLIVLKYDSSYLTALGAGSYYYIVTAQKGGTKVRSKGDAIIILK